MTLGPAKRYQYSKKMSTHTVSFNQKATKMLFVSFQLKLSEIVYDDQN